MYRNENPIKNNANTMPYMNAMPMLQQNNPMMVMPQQNSPMMPMQQQCCPMMAMPENQLETMYPKTYQIINPVVMNYCDMMDMKYGVMNNPTKEQLDEVCEDICKDVETEVDKVVAAEMKEGQRQLGFGGRYILRDLAGILLLRELLRRRRPFGYPGYGYPGYGFPGYGFPGYGGYYGY